MATSAAINWTSVQPMSLEYATEYWTAAATNGSRLYCILNSLTGTEHGGWFGDFASKVGNVLSGVASTVTDTVAKVGQAAAYATGEVADVLGNFANMAYATPPAELWQVKDFAQAMVDHPHAFKILRKMDKPALVATLMEAGIRLGIS